MVWSYRLLEEKRAGAPTDGVAVEAAVRRGGARARGLFCARCGFEITHEEARTVVDERHEHTFANPHGYVFRIGCFREAPGVALHGSESAEFSWFGGYTWIFAACGRCARHLGWRFRGDDVFYGLVLDELVGRDEGAGTDG